jgi:hypothetical protein
VLAVGHTSNPPEHRVNTLATRITPTLVFAAAALVELDLFAQCADPPAPPQGFAIVDIPANKNLLITYSDGYRSRVDV